MPLRQFKNIAILVIVWFITTLNAEDNPIKIFGYFQNGFQHQKTKEPKKDNSDTELKKLNTNSFLMQQLNIFMQKKLSEKWSTFINLEMLNSYSSNRRWGSFNLEEAWIKYRARKEFSLKLGLQIPIFNNLNEIKNKTPLLPYIIRPLVYESSFGEFLSLEEYQPFRAFVQAYGFIPKGKFKADYAIYLGNSSNVNDNKFLGQTGIDTTANILIGGRIGIRYRQLKCGVSVTFERVNYLKFYYNEKLHLRFPVLSSVAADYEDTPAYRFGSDFSYFRKNIYFESEYIRVTYKEELSVVNFDKWFYYGTLGYRILEHMDSYVSYWFTRENHIPQEFLVAYPVLDPFEIDVVVGSIGFAHNITDNIIFKGQWASVKIQYNGAPFTGEKFTTASVAVTVVF